MSQKTPASLWAYFKTQTTSSLLDEVFLLEDPNNQIFSGSTPCCNGGQRERNKEEGAIEP